MPHQDLQIKFTPSNLNTGGNFLDPTDGESGTQRVSEALTFTPTGNPNEFTSTLEVPTIDDPNSASGTIRIVLVDDTEPKNYTISGAGSTAEATVTDLPIRQLSLNNITSTITNEGMPAMVVVSTDEDPRQQLAIKYTPTTIKGSYLNTTDGISDKSRTTDMLTFSHNTMTNKFEATFPVATNSDDVDADHGEILVVLDEPGTNAGYTVASAPSNQNKIIVHDDETPLIKIAPPTLTQTIAGNNVKFILTTELEPWQDLEIQFTPDNETGKNFLDSSIAGIIDTSGPIEF